MLSLAQPKMGTNTTALISNDFDDFQGVMETIIQTRVGAFGFLANPQNNQGDNWRLLLALLTDNEVYTVNISEVWIEEMKSTIELLEQQMDTIINGFDKLKTLQD